MYDVGGRKYMDLELEGQVHRVKVPWRYGRVIGCTVEGLRPVQTLEVDEVIYVSLLRKLWQGQTHLVLERIKPERLV